MTGAAQGFLVAGFVACAIGIGAWMAHGISFKLGEMMPSSVQAILGLAMLCWCAAYILNRRDKYLKRKFGNK